MVMIVKNFTIFVECNLLRYFQQYKNVDPKDDIQIIVKDCEITNRVVSNFSTYTSTYELTISLPYDDRVLSKMKLTRGGIALSFGFNHEPDKLTEHVVNHGDTILLV